MRIPTPLALLAAIGCVLSLSAKEFTLLTYNIRLDIASDAPNHWENRREQLAAQVGFIAPEAFGIQEGLPQQVDYLDEALPQYSYTGIGRDDGKRAGEFSAIFYRTDAVELLESDTFWLSETPEEPSFGWGAKIRRICTYAHFRQKETGKTYWIFNTHFDHETPLARINGAKLILARIAKLVPENEPYFLMGDLNSIPSQPPIQLIAKTLRDSRKASKLPPFGSEATFNGFDTATPPENRIDYIFASPTGSEVLAYGCLSDLVDQRYISDHFPVVARVRLTR